MKIVDVNDTDLSLQEIEQLYESSFPLAERRRWRDVVQMFDEPTMNFQKIIDSNINVGFVVWWRLGEWLYVEHLAVQPASRGTGIGKLVMEHLKTLSVGRLVLETEPGWSEVSNKRIRFYESLGLKIMPYDYAQPPYRKNETGCAMHLMSLNPITDVSEFNQLRLLIEKEVYEKFQVE